VNSKTPTRANMIALKQILNLILRGMINRLALETGVEAKPRSLGVVSHLSVALICFGDDPPAKSWCLTRPIWISTNLFDPNHRGVCWVTLAKENMKFRGTRNHSKGHESIIQDQIIALQGKHKEMTMRRVEAWVEVEGAWRVMIFITNNMEWRPRSVCDLFRRRWDMEVIFKAGQAEPQARQFPR
jgi:hypothetical protein